MIIEMLGAPGSGKTSLLTAVGEVFAACRRPAYTVVEAARPFAARTSLGRTVARLPAPLRRPLLWQVFYAAGRVRRAEFARRRPQLVEGVLAYQQERPLHAEDAHHVLHWFNHLTGAYTFLSETLRPDEALILDEGFVHRVVQLFASELEEPDLADVFAYLERVPRPDLVIHVSAPLAECQERVFARGVWPRFAGKSRADTLRFIACAHGVVEAAAGYLRQCAWPLVSVENPAGGLEAARAALKSDLARWLDSRPEPAL